VADLYPKSSFADDGLSQAGYALQEGGDLEGARAVWMRALEEFPAGDTVPEATFRLAFALYLGGQGEEARKVAFALGNLPLDGDSVHVAAGRYWAARWALYPQVAAPTVAEPDPERLAAAIEGWKSLCEQLPHSFYAIEAWSRLKDVAPDVADALLERKPDHDAGAVAVPWSVRQSFFETPAVRAGVSLARLGLIQEARAEWGAVPEHTLSPDEMAWFTELRWLAGDWLDAHDDMRQWLLTHPPGTLGDREPQILRVTYPDQYWLEVQKQAVGYGYEPRLLHALVREESDFNRAIVSHAGAHGLSQLMPATAREVAGWLHISVSTAQLDDPSVNLQLGGRYFDAMHRQHAGSPYLSLAAYNAGGGRVKEWRAAWGNVPTDEFVERIPFRETRGYVKRVMGSWQTMRWQFDETPAFYDLSAYNHAAFREP
jgi:soluble lytic murein transglycosylase